MSSPKITKMFGFFCCACAEGCSAMARITIAANAKPIFFIDAIFIEDLLNVARKFNPRIVDRIGTPSLLKKNEGTSGEANLKANRKHDVREDQASIRQVPDERAHRTSLTMSAPSNTL